MVLAFLRFHADGERKAEWSLSFGVSRRCDIRYGLVEGFFSFFGLKP
jgi:hypothetical protein